MNIEVIAKSLAILTIIAQIFSIVIAATFIFKKPLAEIRTIITKYALHLSFLVALVATLGSLFFSEIAGYTPCVLCWYQRILMYPQALILGLALWKKDKSLTDYTLLLSVFGGIIALYHYLLQVGLIKEVTPCSTVGYSVSCAQKFTMEYGYITIPMMSLSAFILIILLQLLIKFSKKNTEAKK